MFPIGVESWGIPHRIPLNVAFKSVLEVFQQYSLTEEKSCIWTIKYHDLLVNEWIISSEIILGANSEYQEWVVSKLKSFKIILVI